MMSMVEVRAEYTRSAAAASGDGLRRVKLENGEQLACSEDPTARSDCSTDSSSIGQPDDVSDDEVQSTLSSLASLEDSLPIKRGLSKYYVGKSKSFGNLLGEVPGNVKEIGKSENPFNKKRRTLIAYNVMFNDKKEKKSGGLFYSHSSHISMPLLPLAEDDDDDDYYAPCSFAPSSHRLQQINTAAVTSTSTSTSTSSVSHLYF